MLKFVTNFIEWRYSHYITCFTAGAGLELFMNFFQVGEANIYRSIKRTLSTTRAEEQFEAERAVFERFQSSIEEDD